MSILTSPFDESLAVCIVRNSRIRLPSLPVTIDPIAFEVAKMGVDRFARHLGLLGAMQLAPPPLGIELDDPRLHSDATGAEASARIALPTTIVSLTKK